MNFNILKEPWITAKYPYGLKKMNLMEFLSDCHLIEDILPIYNLPITNYVIYRFLTVIIMESYHLGNNEDVIAVIEDGKIDMNKINKYIDQCEREGVSFDLFDEERPFLQTSKKEFEGMKGKKDIEKPISKLCLCFPSGNNRIFLHPETKADNNEALENAYSLYPDEYFIFLLLQLTQNVFTGKGYRNGVTYNSELKSNPYFMLIKGNNVFETLMFSMGINHNPNYDDALPLYRRKEYIFDLRTEERNTRSFLTYAFFSPVYLRYGRIEDGKVQTICTIVPNQYGEGKFANPSEYNSKETDSDPHILKKKTVKNKEDIICSLCPSTSYAPWDDLQNMILLFKNSYSRPAEGFDSQFVSETLKLFKELIDYEIIEKTWAFHSVLYFMNQKRGNSGFNLQGKREYSIPQSVVINRDKTDTVLNILDFSQKCSRLLQKALKGIWEKNGKPYLFISEIKRNFLIQVERIILYKLIPELDLDVSVDIKDYMKRYYEEIKDICISLFLNTTYRYSKTITREEKKTELEKEINKIIKKEVINDKQK